MSGGCVRWVCQMDVSACEIVLSSTATGYRAAVYAGVQLILVTNTMRGAASQSDDPVSRMLA